MEGILKTIVNVSRSALCSCPYTALAKKAYGFFKGNAQDSLESLTDGEKNAVAKIKMGRNIALIGSAWLLWRPIA